MFLMFSLKRENVLPTGDFGVRMAMYRHYLDVQRTKAAKQASVPRKGAQEENQVAHTEADGKNRQMLGTLPQRGLLVLVEKPRHKNPLVTAGEFRNRLCCASFCD